MLNPHCTLIMANEYNALITATVLDLYEVIAHNRLYSAAGLRIPKPHKIGNITLGYMRTLVVCVA